MKTIFALAALSAVSAQANTAGTVTEARPDW